MARKLQDALALASYRARNSVDNLAVDYVEDNNMGRKRRRSSTTTSPNSSSSSEPQLFSSTFGSSPIKALVLNFGISHAEFDEGPQKRTMTNPRFTYSSPRKRSVRQLKVAQPIIETSRNTWMSTHKLSESSPALHYQHAPFPLSHVTNDSFLSVASTVPSSPPLGHVSDEETSLPHGSFNQDAYSFNASGPRTPPPTRTRSARHRKSNPAGEGARLLLDLASSPSPANFDPKTSGMYPPSTPPSYNAVLGSSMMTTPKNGGYTAAPITPGPAFNYADFIHMTPTPSPAQGAFGSYTPGLPNTPLAAKEARKKLQEGGLAPGDGSPMAGRSGRKLRKETGLGMELGGELLPS